MCKDQAAALVPVCAGSAVLWLLCNVKEDSKATLKHMAAAASLNLLSGNKSECRGERESAGGPEGWAALHAEWWLFEALVLLAGILPNPDQARVYPALCWPALHCKASAEQQVQ